MLAWLLNSYQVAPIRTAEIGRDLPLSTTPSGPVRKGRSTRIVSWNCLRFSWAGGVDVDARHPRLGTPLRQAKVCELHRAERALSAKGVLTNFELS